MKYVITLSTIIFCILLMFSCTNDTGTVTVNYLEATAFYGNIDDVRSTPINAEAIPIQNPGKIYIGEDYFLIGEEGEGVHVINNKDRANPIATAFIQIPGNKEFYVEGNMLYAESYYDVLKIDISNPYNAVLLQRSEYAIQEEFKNDEGETLIGFSYEPKTITLDENDDFMNEIIDDQLVYFDFARNIIPNSSVPSSFTGNSVKAIGTINRITKSIDYVYIVSNNNMIIVNDNDFDNVVKIENIMEEMETVFPYANNLFVGSKTSMSIFNITNGNQPTKIYEFEHARSCDPVLPFNGVAYVTLRTADFSACPGNINALLVIDISDLSNPYQVNEFQLASPYGMSIINDHLFIGNGNNGLNIYEVSKANEPILVHEITDMEVYDIIADPNNSEYIFISGTDGMKQFLLNEDFSLQLKSTIDY